MVVRRDLRIPRVAILAVGIGLVLLTRSPTAQALVPAVVEASVATIPSTLNVNEEFHLELQIWNAAEVVSPNDADILGYSIRSKDVDGALLNFSAFGQADAALGGGNVYHVELDASTLGTQTDAILIASGNQDVVYHVCPQCLMMDDQLAIPISYEVIASALYGDYNEDNLVDAADYTVWRDNLGANIALPNEDPSASPGSVTNEDYTAWKTNFGQTLAGGGAGGAPSAAVPEPAGWLLLWWGVCLVPRRVATLKGWTRKT